MRILSGTIIAKQILSSLQQQIANLPGRKPGLAFIRVGDDPSSLVYIRKKQKQCQEVGILSFDTELPESTTQEELCHVIKEYNNTPFVDGILVQLPLPAHLDPLSIIETIDPRKDVDGFHPMNMGKLLLGQKGGIIPCTPAGIHHLLIESQVPLAGKHVVIVGRSAIVGKPLAALLVQKAPTCNATVTIVHSQSLQLPQLCKEADVLIAAMGCAKYITSSFVKPGAVVIDVGINKVIQEGIAHLVGDVDFASTAPLCQAITPVPGGVGPMTIAYLLKNTLECYETNIRKT